MAATEDMRFDVRTLAYLKRRGQMSEDELEAFLATLPDDAEHGEPTVTRFAATWADRNDDASE